MNVIPGPGIIRSLLDRQIKIGSVMPSRPDNYYGRPDGPIAMSIQEAAIQLRVSESTLRRLANSGRLPGATRLGTRIIIHRDTLEGWLSKGMGE